MALAPFVLIVSRDTSEALSLRSFFQLAGLECATSSGIGAGGGQRPPSIVVVFPDEVLVMSAGGVRLLMRRFAESTVVIVSSATAFFESLAQEAEVGSCGALVLPLPIWGWVLAERLLAVTRSNSRPVARSLM